MKDSAFSMLTTIREGQAQGQALQRLGVLLCDVTWRRRWNAAEDKQAWGTPRITVIAIWDFQEQ
jgi:hypothetical protein